MTASNSLKTLLAGMATVAVVSTAIAQSNPPQPANPNPVQGAGQQSSQSTPMGSTGTPAGGGATSGSTGSSATTGTGSTMGSGSGSSSSSSNMGNSSTAGSSSNMGTTTTRPARADRN